MPDQAQPETTKLHLEGGSPPLMPELAAVMPAGPALMDQLVTEFAPTAATLSTQQAYWIALNGWMTDRLSGPIMEGKVTADDIGEQAWGIYASSYWGGLELRENWGMPAAFENMGMTPPQPPFAEVQQGMVAFMTERMAAIRGGGEACLEILPAILREPSPSAPIHGTAYNAGVQVVTTEDPPIGQRRPQRKPMPAAVRINGRDFMRVDYDLPTPQYLKEWRSAFERAVTSHPDEYEAIIEGGEGDPNLREMWKTAVAFGNITWGGEALDNWTDAFWEESVRWSSVVNFGLEATAQAAFVALLNQDLDAATRAVMCHTIYVGTGWGWMLGFLDVNAKLPQIS